MKEISIHGKKIGKNSPVFLIAEAGVNHNGELALAKKLIDLASEAKVDAVKFQTLIAENLLLKTTPKVDYQKVTTGDQENFYEMVKKLEFTKEEFKIIKNYCEEKDIIFLSTPFDEVTVEWLDEIGVAAFKIGSTDMNNLPMLRLVCSKKKPIFLSTGMANLEEVRESVNYIKSNGIKELVVFQCTTNYPSNYEELNLNVIDTYRSVFPDTLIGFSDHSLGIEASIAALAKGVNVIEKHFTLDKEMEGPDHKASLSPEELFDWVRAMRNVEKALGSYEKIPSENEMKIAQIARKSIVTIKNLQKGETLNNKNIGIKRPGYGIPPKFFDNIIGKKAKKKIPTDSILSWEDIE